MRLIDADDVIEMISHYLGEKLYASYPNDKMPDFDKGVIDGYARARSIVFETPTIDPVKHGQWIPCSERLPEDYTDVLVWFEYFRYGDYNCLYQTYGIGDYSTEYDSWMINHETGWHKLRVIAWMPLPKPWEGEQP